MVSIHGENNHVPNTNSKATVPYGNNKDSRNSSAKERKMENLNSNFSLTYNKKTNAKTKPNSKHSNINYTVNSSEITRQNSISHLSSFYAEKKEQFNKEERLFVKNNFLNSNIFFDPVYIYLYPFYIIYRRKKSKIRF